MMAQQQIDEPNMELIDFDVNMFDAILQFLPPDDLAALAQTCTKFKREVERYFSYKQPNHARVEIGNRRGKASFRHSFQYQEYFQSLIKNVEVHLFDSSPTHHLFEFIRENCPEKLRLLEVANWSDQNIRFDEFETIAEKLSSLEILDIFGVRLDITDYCVNLRKLVIRNSENDQNNSWLNQVWSKLEMFCYNNYFGTSIIMNDFLRKHSHLKNVFCIGESAVRSLCSTEVNLSHVAVHLIRFDGNLRVLNNLIGMCNQKMIKSLDIAFSGMWESHELTRILSLNALKSIHIRTNDFEKFLTNRIYPNIEMLCIQTRFISMTNEEFQKRLKCFPNIKVLRIKSYCNVLPTEILFWVIANIPSLQHAFIYTKSTIDANVIIKLNNERAKLQIAKTVKIHLQRECIQLDSMQWDQEFIAVVPSDGSISCPGCHPLHDLDKTADYVSTMFK